MTGYKINSKKLLSTYEWAAGDVLVGPQNRISGPPDCPELQSTPRSVWTAEESLLAQWMWVYELTSPAVYLTKWRHLQTNWLNKLCVCVSVQSCTNHQPAFYCTGTIVHQCLESCHCWFLLFQIFYLVLLKQIFINSLDKTFCYGLKSLPQKKWIDRKNMER